MSKMAMTKTYINVIWFCDLHISKKSKKNKNKTNTKLKKKMNFGINSCEFLGGSP